MKAAQRPDVLRPTRSKRVNHSQSTRRRSLPFGGRPSSYILHLQGRASESEGSGRSFQDCDPSKPIGARVAKSPHGGTGECDVHSNRSYFLLKYCTARSCFFAASFVSNVPKLRRFPVFGSFFREYRRHFPDFSFRIIAAPLFFKSAIIAYMN